MRYLDLSERRSPVSRLPSMNSPWTNPSLLVCDLLHHAMWPSHVLASFNRCNLTEWAQSIYPAMWTGNSRSWSLASTTTFRYLKVSPLLSRYISHVVWCDQPYLPVAKIWYNLTVKGMNYVSIFWVCPSHHSPNDMTPLLTDVIVHDQETVIICYPTN